MLQYVLYLLTALFATTVGSMTGMGGGVIIKPVLDLLGQYDAVTIGLLSSITVLAMSLVSLGKQVAQRVRVRLSIALPLALGSMGGGILGDQLLAGIIAAVGSNRSVVIVQNVCLGLLILGILVYMRQQQRLPTLHRQGIVPALCVGLLLGLVSSFLGIGGGPINVALLMFVFSYDIKTATVCSIITILFAQLSKLGFQLAGRGFGGYDLSMLPVMVSGAVFGGFIGAALNRRMREQSVRAAFNAVQLLVLCMCIVNIAKAVWAG